MKTLKIAGVSLAALMLITTTATPVLAQRMGNGPYPCRGTWWVERADLEIGEKAPDFGFDSCKEQDRAISDLEGQPVLVNFWATWCPPCIKELPHFMALAQDEDSEVKVLGVSLDRDPLTLGMFLDKYPLGYEVTWDGGGIAADLGINSVPFTVAIDSQGTVVDVHRGYITEVQLQDLVEKLEDSQASK